LLKKRCKKDFTNSQSVGLEPTLPEGIWFLVRRLNRSATTASNESSVWKMIIYYYLLLHCNIRFIKKKFIADKNRYIVKPFPAFPNLIFLHRRDSWVCGPRGQSLEQRCQEMITDGSVLISNAFQTLFKNLLRAK
jgi:hypothetical protein